MAALRAPDFLSSAWSLGAELLDPNPVMLFTHMAPKLPDGRQRAFPTAEGFGAAAKGGRGGRAIFVTTTAESGEGSLRACIEAIGPRTCVFRLSGTITLEEASLAVHNPYLTIAGETAPGDGIAIRNGPKQARPSIEILAHDVIVRHIRVRPGPHEVKSCCSGAIGLYGNEAKDIILDHVSASWGSDETIDSEDASFVTIQWSFITEPLLDGGPGKHNRARSMLLTKGGNFSIHHNLFALGKFRNPQIVPSMRGSSVSIVNNVLYSPVWQYAISFGDSWTVVRANVVGNYKVEGETEKNGDSRLVHLFNERDRGFSVFLDGNLDETHRPELGIPEEEAIQADMREFLAPAAFPSPLIRTTSATQAYEDVLAGAGATRPGRDSVDRRTVDAVRTRSGKLLKHDPRSVGGWPLLASTPAPADQDRDGMSNDWERSHGLDYTDPRDANDDLDGDGWTNLEEYLHVLAGDGEQISSGVATENAE
ncbi:pectate lyase [Arvimicrobium flavum]|uniref:pectate lyase n=1 Tax=Arvimicrobium flavum TaxID=3393320 RepID=UPI00237B5F86|nr:pectate lyase [Mesorhizobium shangrilense]